MCLKSLLWDSLRFDQISFWCYSFTRHFENLQNSVKWEFYRKYLIADFAQFSSAIVIFFLSLQGRLSSKLCPYSILRLSCISLFPYFFSINPSINWWGKSFVSFNLVPSQFQVCEKVKKTKKHGSVAFMMQICLWWRHRFWNLWISQKHKNLDISRMKHYFFSSNEKITLNLLKATLC